MTLPTTCPARNTAAGTMARRGPAPKPAALKLVDGTQRSKINRAEPLPPDAAPAAPAGLSGQAREVWDKTVADLDAMKILSAVDAECISAYVAAVCSHRSAAAAIEADGGAIVRGEDGACRPHPAVRVQEAAGRTMRHWAQEFGLTPAARARIEVKPAARADNPFAAAG